MLNIVVLASLVSLFPAVAVRPMGRDQGWLVATALALTGLVTGLVAIGGWGGVGPVSLGTVLILGGYLAGMSTVYRARTLVPEEREVEIRENPGGKPPLSERGWFRFALAAGGVLVAAPLLATSADRLADVLGISGSFMGVLAVAIVTTMPETSVTFGALRLGSGEMALGNVYGSCAFNVAILGLADLLYPQPIFHTLDRSHLVAGLGALLLMALGPGFLYLRTRGRLRASQMVALGIVGIWVGVMFFVFYQARGVLPWPG